MKKIMFTVLALVLVNSFAFANTKKKVTTVKYTQAIVLLNSLKSSSLSYTVHKIAVDSQSTAKAVDCLLKITFILEDGTTETVVVVVRGVSCKEILE